MSKKNARLAVTAGLTAALSFGGVMAPVTMAFAAGDQGSITIHKAVDKNTGNTFKAYQIFKAKVADEKDNGKVASDIKWANDAIGSKVITAITGSTEYQELVTKDPTKKLKDDPSASDVAEWLSQNVKSTASTASSSEGTRVAPGNVLYEIAAAVSGMKENVKAETAAGRLTAGESWTRPNPNENRGLYGDGYYLFVSDGLTDPAKPNTGTSPIFAIVGGDPVVVTEKTSIPTVNKWILNDNKQKTADEATENDWEKHGDSQVGQEIDYKLTGSVADNIASYETYEYKFQDALSEGLAVTKDQTGTAPKDLHVYIVNGGKKTKVKSDPTNGYQAFVTPGTTAGTELLEVSFKNLKAVQDFDGNPISVDAASTVVVTYKAQLTDKAVYETTGNTNAVKLVYSNNPMGTGEGISTESTVTDYVFGLDVTKVDEGTGDPLKGNQKLQAGFKVRVVKGDEDKDDDASQDKWLGEHGEIVGKNQAHEFKTDVHTGKILIPGLDAGTYEITETTTPSGYNTITPFQITVTPTYDETGTLTELKAEPRSGMVTARAVEHLTTTKIPVTIKNKKGSGLPLTGLNGVTFTWIAGGAVLCIGVAHLIRSRKQAEESEQE
ncbi:MAG: isopeptide-forming domain-containing fimbrial protein [Collinsella sp.]|nr:isopeptide-forming domain-containing fimbrial protein [Collinsella sp.]